MTYLVDANVLSETTRPQPNAKVVSWLHANEQALAVDPIILGEIQIGVLSLPHGQKRGVLESWIKEVTESIECIPWDREVSTRWARLVVDQRKRGTPLPLLDSMIAATALVYDLTVATRNVRDFQRAGLRVVDPFL